MQQNIGKALLNGKLLFQHFNAGGGENEGPKETTATDFAIKLLKAMVPSPELLGNTLSGLLLEDKAVDSLTNKEELERATLSDRGTHAKSVGKRSSTTAMKCSTTGCNNYHFLPTGMCAIHSGLKKETQTVFRSSESTRLEDLRPELSIGDHYAVLGQLRSEMLSIAQSFDNSSSAFIALQTEASSLLKGIQLDNVEKGQLLYQFRLLDNNKNGTIDAADLLYHITTFDIDFLKDFSVPDKENKVVQWIKEVNGNQPSMTLVQYATALVNYRKSCDAEGAILELNRYAFWDLRSVVLSCPTISKKSGWILKRGYYFSKENLNPWAFRYFEVEGTKLNYYSTVPGTTTDFEGKETEHKLLKSINLLECAVVDFSPKTVPPAAQTKSLDTPLTFKITTYNGKRLTLATSRQDVIEWVAYLSWFSNASKLAFEWRSNFGSIRKVSITLRDYIMLGSIVAKIMRGEEILAKAPEKKGTKEFEDEYGLSDIDEYYIKLFGFTRENVKDAQGKILHAIKFWKMFKMVASKADEQYTQGIGKTIIEGITTAVNTYVYAAATKNQFNRNRYGVIWDSKSGTGYCAICKFHFKSFSLRQTMAKHHCR